MDNAVAAVFDLSANREERFFVEDDPCEYNILVIKNGQVSVSEASCPDQICVHHKKIEHEGESIVCLPHKFVVTISHEKMDGSDEN